MNVRHDSQRRVEASTPRAPRRAAVPHAPGAARAEPLTEAADPFRLLVEGIKDYAIFLLDADGHIVKWSKAAERITGYAAAEVQGRHCEVLHTASDIRRGVAQQQLGAAAKLGRHETQGWRVRKDGSRLWAEVVTAAITDAGGNVRGFSKVIRDITERRQAEQALSRAHAALEANVQRRTAQLAQSNEQLRDEVAQRARAEQTLRDTEAFTRAILDNAVDAIITIDERGYVELFNRAAEQMFGYAADEVRGRNVSLLMPEPYAGEHDGYMHSYLRTGRKRIIGIGREVSGRRKDGSVFPLDLAVSEVRLGERRTFTGLLRDITERKRLEKEVLEISEREQRRIGQDLHDGVCQQLTGIAFLVQALQQQLAHLGSAQAQQAAQVSALLKDAVTQARNLSHGLYPVDPQPDGLMVALRLLAATTRELFRVDCSSQCPRPVPMYDNSAATHLYRIAQEAVQNAIRHGRASRIRIRLSSDAAGAVTLSIADNGVGLANGGNKPMPGMGLRTMSHRAHVIGATLEIVPPPGGGTRVVCRLPEPKRPTSTNMREPSHAR